MTSKINAIVPWQEMRITCENSEQVWVTLTDAILEKLEDCDFSTEDFGDKDVIPHITYEKIIICVEKVINEISCNEYYVRLGVRFNVFQTLVGLLVNHMSSSDERTRKILTKLAMSLVVCSVRQPPFTLPVWKQLYEVYVREDAKPDFSRVIHHSEMMLMELSGQSIYSFFTDVCTNEEIEELLKDAHEQIRQEDELRRYTIKHGHGHSKTIVSQAIQWMRTGKLRRQNHIYPLIRSLSAYWHHEFNLGTSQGAERMYKKLYEVYDL